MIYNTIELYKVKSDSKTDKKIGVLWHQSGRGFCVGSLLGMQIMPVFKDEKRYELYKKDYLKDNEFRWPPCDFYMVDAFKLNELLNRDPMRPLLGIPRFKKTKIFFIVIKIEFSWDIFSFSKFLTESDYVF